MNLAMMAVATRGVTANRGCQTRIIKGQRRCLSAARLPCFGPARRALRPAHLIHRLIQMAGDMETIQHVQPFHREHQWHYRPRRRRTGGSILMSIPDMWSSGICGVCCYRAVETA